MLRRETAVLSSIVTQYVPRKTGAAPPDGEDVPVAFHKARGSDEGCAWGLLLTCVQYAPPPFRIVSRVGGTYPPAAARPCRRNLLPGGWVASLGTHTDAGTRTSGTRASGTRANHLIRERRWGYAAALGAQRPALWVRCCTPSHLSTPLRTVTGTRRGTDRRASPSCALRCFSVQLSFFCFVASTIVTKAARTQRFFCSLYSGRGRTTVAQIQPCTGGSAVAFNSAPSSSPRGARGPLEGGA